MLWAWESDLEELWAWESGLEEELWAWETNLDLLWRTCRLRTDSYPSKESNQVL